MTAGKSTRSNASAAAKGSKLAVKCNEADKWKPTTNFRKEKRRPAPTIRNQRSWPSALNLFQQDFLKEFRDKNPKDKSSDDAVFQAASDRWKSLSNSDKAPYEARSFALMEQCKKAIARTATYRKTWYLRGKMEVEMDKLKM